MELSGPKTADFIHCERRSGGIRWTSTERNGWSEGSQHCGGPDGHRRPGEGTATSERYFPTWRSAVLAVKRSITDAPWGLSSSPGFGRHRSRPEISPCLAVVSAPAEGQIAESGAARSLSPASQAPLAMTRSVASLARYRMG